VDVAQSQRETEIPKIDLGPMGEITLDELRAIAQDTRTFAEILLG